MKLSAVIIAKNEESCIERCLKSIVGVDEIIVCDTGSEDRTIEIAKKYTDKVYTDYKWEDSFAKARNYAKSKATSDWIFSPDCDEVLEEGGIEKIRKVIELADDKWAVNCAMCAENNHSSIHILPLIYRNIPEVKWESAIHNYLSVNVDDAYGAKDPNEVTPNDIHIYYGYSKAHALDPDRAFRILGKEIEKNPKLIREKFYYAREYWYREKYVEALAWYEEYLKVAWWSPEWADAWLMKAKCLVKLNRYEDARNACLQAIKINTNYKEALLYMADLCGPGNKKRWEKFASTANNDGILFVNVSSSPEEMIEVCFLVYKRFQRLPKILKQLKEQTIQNFRVNIWNNSGQKLDVSDFPQDRIRVIDSKENVGSQARFKLAKQTAGNPIIFFDDDEDLYPNFVEYHYEQYQKFGRACILGYFTRTFNKESYWDSEGADYGNEVDYVATKSMIFNRKILDIEKSLENIPEQFAKVEDLYLCYIARMKYGMKMVKINPASKGIVDNQDQWVSIDKEKAFKELREMGWWVLRDTKRKILLKNYNREIWVDTSLPNNDVIKRGLANKQFYEEDLLEFAKGLPLDKDKSIVDVGANVGNHTMFFSLFCPNNKIFAFEPYDKVRTILENHVKFNNLNVRVIPYAVGDKEGYCDLEKSPENEAGIEWDGRTHVKEGNVIKVVTLANALRGKKISLIKIDVEGYEYKVLLGASKILEKQHPFLFIEAKTALIKKEIDDYLLQFGYKPKKAFNPPSPTYFYE